MQNPFYNNPNNTSSAPPPSYSSRPSQPSTSSAAPAQYSSLADLTKNKPVPPPRPGTSGFSYTPDPSRQGYAPGGSNGYVPPRGDGRRMPPPPTNQGMGVPSEPPRRVAAGKFCTYKINRLARLVPATDRLASSNYPSTAFEGSTRPASGPASYLPASAQGYANTASSYATAGVGKAREGLDSVFTQQRVEQVNFPSSPSYILFHKRLQLIHCRLLPAWVKLLREGPNCWVRELGGWASLLLIRLESRHVDGRVEVYLGKALLRLMSCCI